MGLSADTSITVNHVLDEGQSQCLLHDLKAKLQREKALLGAQKKSERTIDQERTINILLERVAHQLNEVGGEAHETEAEQRLQRILDDIRTMQADVKGADPTVLVRESVDVIKMLVCLDCSIARRILIHLSFRLFSLRHTYSYMITIVKRETFKNGTGIGHTSVPYYVLSAASEKLEGDVECKVHTIQLMTARSLAKLLEGCLDDPRVLQLESNMRDYNPPLHQWIKLRLPDVWKERLQHESQASLVRCEEGKSLGEEEKEVIKSARQDFKGGKMMNAIEQYLTAQ